MEISQRFQRKLSTVWESRQAAISAATNQQCLLLHSDGHSESQDDRVKTKSKSDLCFLSTLTTKKKTKQNQQEKNTHIFDNSYFSHFRNQEKQNRPLPKQLLLVFRVMWIRYCLISWYVYIVCCCCSFDVVWDPYCAWSKFSWYHILRFQVRISFSFIQQWGQLVLMLSHIDFCQNDTMKLHKKK